MNERPEKRHPNQTLDSQDVEEFKRDFVAGLQFGREAWRFFRSAFGRFAKTENESALVPKERGKP